VEVVCTRPILLGPSSSFREGWLAIALSTKSSEHRVVVEVARVTGGEKMEVVSDSGVEVDIRVQANGLPDVADLTVQKNRISGRLIQQREGYSWQKGMQKKIQIQ
jgi:hypothetical protein